MRIGRGTRGEKRRRGGKVERRRGIGGEEGKKRRWEHVEGAMR